MAKRIRVEKGRWQYGLECACTLIQQGRAVAFPTDTYYGLGVNPFNLAAINKLFELKKRNHHKPVLLAVSSVEQAEELTGELSPLFYRLVDRFWPGPLTLVLPAAKGLPFKITGNTGKVALRYPDCEFAVALAKAAALPLTATSANISEMPPCATAEEVDAQLGDRLPLILDTGPTPGGKPSTILELTQDQCRVIRHGQVPVEDLDEFLF